uniref:Uncharacterized protein n=1 Tax=Romanomermis culicivorax TaxID=13658 RepID=A0A915KCZ4_ROMCU
MDDIKDVFFCHMQTGSQIIFILMTQGLSCILSFDRLFLIIRPLVYEHNKARLKSLYNNYFDNYEELEQTVLICFMRNSMGKYYDMLFKNLLLCFNVLTILNYLLIVIYLQKSLILKYLPCGIHVTNLRMINTDDDNARLTKFLCVGDGHSLSPGCEEIAKVDAN